MPAPFPVFVFVLIAALGCGRVGVAAAFDHQHRLWDRLLQQHVRWVDGGVASRVDYTGLQRDRARLDAYLQQLSVVTEDQYRSWSRGQQLAFLINAYNAFTVDLILSEYPELDSIKDLGWLLQSPWQQRFFTLLGRERHLDELEHELIRGYFDEPLIHVAVVCASIGCPALRDRAFQADTLERDLTDSMRRFLSDRSRNRYDPETGTLRVSKVFDWYREDFEQGARGYRRLADVFADYAEQLSDDPAVRARIAEGALPIAFLPYDWSLNDLGPQS